MKEYRYFEHVWVRGDTHGDFTFLTQFCKEHNTTENDLLIILGDAGINYYGANKSREKYLKLFIANSPITVLCIRGNHEDRPEDRPEYDLADVGIDDEVYINWEYPNIWFAKDGGEYIINDKSYLTIGGAYSVDKFYRIANGYKWVANEILNVEERAEILDICYRQSYDHIMTHTCPEAWQPTDLFLSCVDQSTVDKTMEQFLTFVEKYANYDHWWFGHFHDDRMDVCGNGKVHMLYNQIEEIV